MKSRKCVVFMILCVMGILIAGNVAKAKEGGTIQIVLENQGEEIQNRKIEFFCTKVAEYIDGKFVSEMYHDDIKVDQHSTANDMRDLAHTLAKKVKKPDQTISVDSDGKATLESVSEGLYLFVVSNQKEQEEIDPFLVSMPAWNEKSGELEYEVKVIPKYLSKERENPVAPQTNVKSYYMQKIICAVLCIVGAGMLFVFCKREESDEKMQ